MAKLPARLGKVKRQILESSRHPAPPLSVCLRAAVALGAATALLLGPFLGSAAVAPPTRLCRAPNPGVGSPVTAESEATAAVGARHHSALEKVAGLEKPVAYSETKISLSELVQKVAADTGVPLTAAREVADEPVAVVVHSMPALELLQQLADLLDYQWHWMSGPRTPDNEHRTPTLEFYQDLASKQREEALRQARLAEVVRRFQAELKTYTEIAALSPEQLQHLAETAKTYWQEWWQTLTPEQRQARLDDPGETKLQQRYGVVQALQAPIPRALATLLGPLTPGQWARLLEEGEVITWSSNPKPAEVRLPLDVERRLRDAKPSWLSPGSRLAFPEPGEEERMREQDRGLKEAWAAASGYRVTLRLDARGLKTQGSLGLSVNAAPFRNGAPLEAELPPPGISGTSLTIRSEPLDALALPETDTQERRAALERDPTLGSKRSFKTAVKPQPNRNGPIAPAWWSLWDLLPELARTYEVDFIADSYWSSSPGLGLTSLPQEPTPLYALLDRAAGCTHHWDHHGKLIRLRSRTWFLDRPREIPLRYVRRWKELLAQRGALPLEAYLEAVTTLTDTQIESLNRLVNSDTLPRDLFGVELCRDMLRLYASLLPAQRETLWHGGILPVPRMTPRQQALFMATVKTHGRIAPPEELTPEQLVLAGLSLKQVPMIRTIDRMRGGAVVSDEPAAAAGTPSPGPAAAPGTLDRIPVTQVLFLVTHGQERRGGVGLVTTPSP